MAGAYLVNITFDTAITKRFINQVGASAVTNNGARIVTHEFFDGDGSAQFDGADYLSIATHADFSFNSAGVSRAWRFRFFAIEDNVLGFISRRADADNRWHLKVDLLTNQILFFARIGGVTVHNATFAIAAPITLARWHTVEMVFEAGTVLFYIDGIYVNTSTDGTATAMTFTAPVEIGRVNDSATGTPNYVYHEGFLDSVNYITGLTYASNVNTDFGLRNNAADNTLTRTWTGGMEKRLSLSLTPRPLILGGAFPQNIPDFEVVANACYISGISPMKKVKSDDTVVGVGITKPAAPVTALGVGALNGTYDYIVTWEDNNGNESGPSPISTARSPAGANGIDVTRPALAGETEVYWNIYRRKTSASQSQHYFLVQVAVGTGSYTDNNADTVPSQLRIAARQTVDKPPVSNFIIYNDGVMFYASIENFPTRLYYSQPNNIEQVDTNDWSYIGNNDSDWITGLGIYDGNVLIFKEHSLFKFVGDPFGSFEIIQEKGSKGCIAHQAIKEADGVLIWPSDAGLEMYTGSGDPELFSDKIEPLFRDMPKARRPYMSAAIDETLGLYLLTFSAKSTTENDTIICFNYRDSLKDGLARWSLWRIEASALFEGPLGANREPRALFGNYDSKIGYFELGALDLLKGISWRWKGTGLSSQPGQKSRSHYLTAVLLKEGDRPNITRLGTDNDNAEILTQYNITTRQSNLKHRIAGRSNFISPVFESIDTRERLRLLGLQIDLRKSGRR